VRSSRRADNVLNVRADVSPTTVSSHESRRGEHILLRRAQTSTNPDEIVAVLRNASAVLFPLLVPPHLTRPPRFPTRALSLLPASLVPS
jgi:hypothetical protein